MDTHGIDLVPALRELYGTAPAGARLARLAGDASTRTYYRLTAPGRSPASLIVMHLPPDPLASNEAGGGTPVALPFLSVQALLHGRGVPVPEVYADDVPRRVVLLEDLGAKTFFDCVHGQDATTLAVHYAQAVDLLVDMHAACAAPGNGLPFERAFDRTLLRWELDHFRQWGIEAVSGEMTAAQRTQLDAHFDALADRVSGLPIGFVHRDYQSRNLMQTPGRGLVVIDFQDALQGPRCYDLVALLCDSYVELSPALQSEMIARYATRAGMDAAGAADFEREFWAVALQRKLKDAGRFVYIDQVRGNPDFLQWFPRSLRYVGRALGKQAEHMPGLLELLTALVPGFPSAAAQPPPRTGMARDAGS